MRFIDGVEHEVLAVGAHGPPSVKREGERREGERREGERREGERREGERREMGWGRRVRGRAREKDRGKE